MNNTTSDKDVANIEKYENFKREFLQQSISFLTKENLDELEEHCLKAMRHERGIEHKITLELLQRYKEYLAEREQDKKRIQELENKYLHEKVAKEEVEELLENSIPKQKVKDLINKNGFEVYTKEYGNVEVVSIEDLQELLEGEE